MSEHLNAIQDLSHAPLAYIKEALQKSEVAVRQLNDELEAERESFAERVRQMEEALHRILAIANDKNLGPRTTVGRMKEEALRTLESSATREARNT